MGVNRIWHKNKIGIHRGIVALNQNNGRAIRNTDRRSNRNRENLASDIWQEANWPELVCGRNRSNWSLYGKFAEKIGRGKQGVIIDIVGKWR